MFDLVPFKRGGSDLSSFFSEMEKNFMHNFGSMMPAIKTDIVDKGDRYILEAEMPGFGKDDINIYINDNKLTIEAEQSENKEENNANYIRRERRYGSFTRSFDVSDVDTEAISADYNNGVLTLELPKKNNTANIKKIDIH